MNEGNNSMNITSVKDQFKVWKSEASKTLGKLEKDLNKIAEPLHRSLATGAIANIPSDFGKFLYSCLGERVCGQTSSVVNAEYLASDAGKRLITHAEEKKCTVEEYLEKHDCTTGYSGNKIFHHTQAYLTAGRKFGVSYVTGIGDRSHTIFFEEGAIFTYLKQQHVDCIRNKAKKECTQAFLDYRNSFMAGLKMLNKNDNLIPLNFATKIAKLSRVNTTPLFDKYNNRDDGLTATVIEDIQDKIVEFASVATPEIDLWDGMSTIHSKTAKRTITSLIPVISVTFGSVNGNGKKTNSTGKSTIVFGNIDISFGAFGHTLNGVMKDFDSVLYHVDASDDLATFNDIINNSAKNERYYNRQNGTMSNGVMLNMVDIVSHPAVQSAIQSRIDFFVSESVKLQELKHKFAGLYFLNSD